MGKRIELTEVYRPKRISLAELDRPRQRAMNDAMSKQVAALGVLAHKRKMKADQMKRYRAKLAAKSK